MSSQSPGTIDTAYRTSEDIPTHKSPLRASFTITQHDDPRESHLAGESHLAEVSNSSESRRASEGTIFDVADTVSSQVSPALDTSISERKMSLDSLGVPDGDRKTSVDS